MSADPLAPLREAVESATRNLGLTADPPALAPEHWQRVLAAVEARATLRGVSLPDGWRDGLAREMGRTGPAAYADLEN